MEGVGTNPSEPPDPGRRLGALGANWKAVSLALAVFGLGALAGAVIAYYVVPRFQTSPAGVPPAEFLYLDNDRVAAYLGQMSGGLSSREKRSNTTSRQAEARAGSEKVVGVGGSVKEDQFVEALVTPLAADRFYDLLGKLRTGDWLDELDAQNFEEFSQKAEDARPGDFVEIKNVQVLTPTYASLLPKASYSSLILLRNQPQITLKQRAQTIGKRRPELRRYLRRLPPDPRVPFVALVGDNKVFLPARYSKLADAPSLLSGRITVVGKVIRNVGSPYPQVTAREATEDAYYDIETVTSFSRALKRAPPSIRKLVHMPRKRVDGRVAKSATFREPALVVVPVAMYH
jgi:hypothetical protein